MPDLYAAVAGPSRFVRFVNRDRRSTELSLVVESQAGEGPSQSLEQSEALAPRHVHEHVVASPVACDLAVFHRFLNPTGVSLVHAVHTDMIVPLSGAAIPISRNGRNRSLTCH